MNQSLQLSVVETVFNVTFESDSASKPVCVAEWIVIFR